MFVSIDGKFVQQSAQIAIGHRLLDYIDQRATALADAVYRQPVVEYVSPQFAERERERLFLRLPLCVGFSSLLPEPGSFFTHDLSGRPLLLTRDAHGDLKAMLNVCRHRGARVATDRGRCRTFVCPYHAWTYGHDGALLSRPEEAAFASSARAAHNLTEVPAWERDGLIWVGGESQASNPPIAPELAAELAGFDLARFHHYETRVLHRRMNWKLLLDTFLETYHFCVLHRDSICSIFHDNLSTFDHWGPHFRIVAARRSIEELRTRPVGDWDLLPHMVGLYILFPNTVLVWQLDHVELWQIFPGAEAPHDSIVQLSLYIPEPADTESARRHWDANMDLVIKVVEEEDFPIGEDVQRGFEAGAQDHLTFGRNEPALAHFHRTVSETVGAL